MLRVLVDRAILFISILVFVACQKALKPSFEQKKYILLMNNHFIKSSPSRG